MFSNKVRKLLEKLPVKISGFDSVDKYYELIKTEYLRIKQYGGSELVSQTKETISPQRKKEHPRRMALMKTGTHAHMLNMSNTELDTWFNENGGQELNLGGGDDRFSYFFPSEIHTEIHQEFDTTEKHKISYSRKDGKTLKINFKIEYPKGKGLTEKERIYMMMRTVILGALSPTLKHYDTIIYPSNSKKDFKNTNSSRKLGASNVNSGVTTIYRAPGITNQTTVFRREELGKLLIHELIHNLEFDFGFNSVDSIRDLHTFFNVPRGSDILLNESYTETVACIVNSIICCIESGKTLVSLHKFLKLELIFNLFQTAKILDYYGFSNAEEINMPDDSLGRFNQSSNVLSYFFLKTALLHNFQNFMDFVDRNSVNFCLKSQESIELQTEFVELIISSTRRPDFIEDINQMMRFIREHRESIPEDLSSTLRMTCVE